MESKHQPKARDRTEHDAAIHVRVSTGQGTGKLAIGRREKKCRERAERDGVEVRLERVYRDLGASAAGSIRIDLPTTACSPARTVRDVEDARRR